MGVLGFPNTIIDEAYIVGNVEIFSTIEISTNLPSQVSEGQQVDISGRVKFSKYGSGTYTNDVLYMNNGEQRSAATDVSSKGGKVTMFLAGENVMSEQIDSLIQPDGTFNGRITATTQNRESVVVKLFVLFPALSI